MKIMKKSLSIILTVVMIISALQLTALNAFAADADATTIFVG